jgi:glycosyltransferase involved in cell wall biosynthesis
MISYDMQDFGGLEEYAVNLAIGLKQQGHEVSYVSCAWVSPENQYARRLKANDIPLVLPPRWISEIAYDWDTKLRILRGLMMLISPLVAVLAFALALFKRRRFAEAWKSAYNFLNGRLLNAVFVHDYRKILSPILLTRWQARWRSDIYHVQGYTNTLLFTVEWAHAKGIPVVYEEHQTPDPQFNWWKGFEHAINLADRVIAVSEKSAQGLREVCQVTQPIVVRGPLLPDPFVSGWHKEYECRQGKTFTITTVARLYVTKGLTYLLDAAAAIRKKYPHVEFKVYGDGELREELLAKASALGLDGETIFPGAFTSRDELNRIMENTDIFLMSSVLEGQPLAVVEAMAYGCPIVTTNVGGIPELIQDNVNGLLCPPENPQCIAENVEMLICDSALRERLGRAARAYYEQSPFEAKSVSEHFTSVYGAVLEERKMPGSLKPSPVRL